MVSGNLLSIPITEDGRRSNEVVDTRTKLKVPVLLSLLPVPAGRFDPD